MHTLIGTPKCSHVHAPSVNNLRESKPVYLMACGSVDQDGRFGPLILAGEIQRSFLRKMSVLRRKYANSFY